MTIAAILSEKGSAVATIESGSPVRDAQVVGWSRKIPVVAAVTVPPGFVATLRGMVQSPKVEVELSHGTISSRVNQQVQALIEGFVQFQPLHQLVDSADAAARWLPGA